MGAMVVKFVILVVEIQLIDMREKYNCCICVLLLKVLYLYFFYILHFFPIWFYPRQGLQLWQQLLGEGGCFLT